jgi:valyl-tRNA synthetase
VEGEIDPAQLGTDDKWILLRLDATIASVSKSLDDYLFADAAQSLYGFFWGEFCDWYLEASKAALQGGEEGKKATTIAVIDFVLAHTLRLFHPFLPFITEELWNGMGFATDLPADQGGRTISFAHWPRPLGEDFRAHYGLSSEDERLAAGKYEAVNMGRTLRRDFNIASNKRVRFVLKPTIGVTEHDAQVLKILLNSDPFELAPEFVPPRGTPVVLTPLGELFLPLEGLVDADAERERLGREIGKIEVEITKVANKLNSDSFVSGAPTQVVEEHRKRLADWQSKLEQLQKLLAALG